MKKLISRKTYNTKTAKLVAMFDDMASSGIREMLYMTERKDFFILGTGPEDSRWKGAEDIIAIDLQAARFWLTTKGFKFKTRNGVINAALRKTA